MSSLIAKVAELQKLHAEEAAPTYSATEGEFTYECAALNALPGVLEALSLVRAGDEEMFRLLLEDQAQNEMEPAYPVSQEVIEFLERYLELARLMESKRIAESELARWRQIAAEERARVLYFAHAGCFP